MLSKNQWVATAVGIGVILIFFGFGFLILPMFSNNSDINGPGAESNSVSGSDLTSSLVVKDEIIGTGAEAVNGSIVSVHYTGTFPDGTLFDSSYNRGEPLKFILGARQVIAGWDQGLLGMKVGGKRQLVIPPNLGYGAQAIGPIPANSTLIFEVELVGVEAPAN